MPQVAERKLNTKAAEVKHSPLPFWLETLVQQHHGASWHLTKNLLNADIKVQGESSKITLMPRSLGNPGVEHITAARLDQEPLNDLGEFDLSNKFL